jgi:hypothetical protein
MAESKQGDGHTNQGVCVLVERDAAMPQSAPKGEKRHPVRIVAGDIVLQILHGPDVVEYEAGNVNIRTAETVGSHDGSFFLSYLRKEIAKIYRRVKVKIYTDCISHCFRVYGA